MSSKISPNRRGIKPQNALCCRYVRIVPNEDRLLALPKEKESLAASLVNRDGVAYGWVPITKVTAEGDNRRVYGLVTNDDIDSDEQIVDADFARRAMAKWFDDGTGFGANVRQQHSTQLAPAGKGISLEDTPKGQYIEALIVEPTAVKLVDAKVYQGFSVGIARPRIVRDAKARGGRIVDGNVVEVSVVDRPANYSAKFQIVKAVGTSGSMQFVGKAVLLDGDPEIEYEAPRRPALKRVHKGTHVTVHARNEYGDLEAYEGLVVNRMRTGIALDRSGYGRQSGVIVIPEDAIEGIYKGAFPLETLEKIQADPILTDEMVTKFTLRIKQDSTGDLMGAMRRVSQWALSGFSPMPDVDLERVYNLYAAEFSSRNPGKKIEDFPATSIGKGRIGKVASLDELVAKFNPNHDERGQFASGDGGGKDSGGPGANPVANMTPYSRNTDKPMQLANKPDRPTRPLSHPGGEKPGVIRNATDKPKDVPISEADRGSGYPDSKAGENTQAGDPEGFGDPSKDSQRTGADERTAPMFPQADPNAAYAGPVVDDEQFARGYTPEAAAYEQTRGKSDEPEVTKTTEENDSVTNETTDKAAATCDKCKGTGMFEGAKCDKCGGTKVVKQAADAHAAAADAHAAAANAADDPDEAAEEAEEASEHADAATEEDDADEKKAAKAEKKAKKAFVPASTAPAAPPAAAPAATPAGPPADAQPAGTAAADAAPVKVKKSKAEKKAAKLARAAVETDEGEIPYAIRKAHDWTCSAYKSDDLIEVYPTIEKRVTSVLGPTTRSALATELGKAIADPDTNAQEIASLGKALGALQEFLDVPDNTDEVMLAARSDMNAAFKADNPSVGDYPKPSESITPGQFKRPYISAGHQDESGHAHAPRIPTTTHPISADDFTRGPLTDGHQRYLSAKMADIHDALVSWKPELCLMDANGSFAFDRQPAASFDRTRFAKEVPNQEKATPTEVSTAAMAAATKQVDLTGQTATSKVYNADELEVALSKAVRPILEKVNKLTTENKNLRQEYEALAASPDPNRSAHRGATGYPVTKVTSADVTKAQRKAKRAAKKADKIADFRNLAASPDPAIRNHAQSRLARMGVDA
jgi:hypothetical protein